MKPTYKDNPAKKPETKIADDGTLFGGARKTGETNKDNPHDGKEGEATIWIHYPLDHEEWLTAIRPFRAENYDCDGFRCEKCGPPRRVIRESLPGITHPGIYTCARVAEFLSVSEEGLKEALWDMEEETWAQLPGEIPNDASGLLVIYVRDTNSFHVISLKTFVLMRDLLRKLGMRAPIGFETASSCIQDLLQSKTARLLVIQEKRAAAVRRGRAVNSKGGRG